MTVVTTNTSGIYPAGHVSDTAIASFILNLADIDPSSVTYSAADSGSDQYATWTATGYTVRVATSDLDKKISHTWQSSGTWYADNGQITPRNSDPKQDQVGKLEFSVADGDIASRIAHAMTHAIELCGGHKSAF